MGRTKGIPNLVVNPTVVSVVSGAAEEVEVQAAALEVGSVARLIPSDDNDDPAIFQQIAIGPNRTISLQVKNSKSITRKKTTKKPPRTIVDQVEGLHCTVSVEQGSELCPEVQRIVIDDETTEFHIGPRLPVSTNPPDRWRLLQTFYLEQSIILLNKEQCVKYWVQTPEGASLLFAKTKENPWNHAIGKAMDDGTLQLECQFDESTRSSILSLYLTTKCLDMCSPQTLVFGSLSSKSIVAKKYLPAMHVHQTLACLFPDSVLTNVVQKTTTTGPAVITAKMVYDTVDNAQLKKYEDDCKNSNNKPSLEIPGLVPTLRPYQQAAVRWMLEREQGDTSQGNEWEVAWLVMVGTTLQPLFHLDNKDLATFFISPFAGWITSTYEEARIATLGHGQTSTQGGILADSMGTGKTVEVIACILANRFGEVMEGNQNNGSLVHAPIDVSSDNETIHIVAPKLEKEKGKNDQPNVSHTPIKRPVRGRKFDFDNEVSDDEDNNSSQSRENTLMTVEHLGTCLCGSEKFLQNGLSMVLCRCCDEPMHGICAGFTAFEELLKETTLEWRNDYFVTKPFAVRLCSQKRCPTCVFSNRNKVLFQSRATLIVTPPSILNQWEREIRRHTAIFSPEWPQTGSPMVSPSKPNKRPLKVVVYPGIRELYRRKPGSLDESLGHPICHLVHADKLGDADVVLMTFDALMGDLGHTDENPFTDNSSIKGLRMRKRYRVTPSPLTSIKWWRICLDEAQRVEVPTATSARMALKLESHFRWCVSGTPIGRGKLEDLYGLVLFLRLYPVAGKQWFDRCLQSGQVGVMDRVQFMLRNVMWRSTKAHPSVRIQMGVPEQIEKKVLLNFSSIEKHFYERQLEKTMVAASEVVGKASRRAKRNGKTDLLAAHLHRLRAACCHPQVGSSGIGRVSKKRKIAAGNNGDGGVSIGTGVLTMDQILDRLIDDAKVQCEESQRIAILHTNALASLSRLKVEAKFRGYVNFIDSDVSLLAQSCSSYMESLEISETNAKPTMLVGEAAVTGCLGFLSQRKVVRDGKAILMWKIKMQGDEYRKTRDLWARFDFEGPSKKITEARLKTLSTIPSEFEEELGSDCKLLSPKTAVFQVSHSSLGGEFVDVVDFDMASKATSDEWLSRGGFRTNKSKGWRLLLNDFALDDNNSFHVTPDDMVTFVVAMEIQMLEADVASDSLQCLHVLHNLSLSMSALQQLGVGCSSLKLSSAEMEEKMMSMHSESRRIESLYMDAARAPHLESQRDLQHHSSERNKYEKEFFVLSNRIRDHEISDLWQDLWWDDLLAICFIHGDLHDRERLCDMVTVALDDFVTDTVEGQKFRSRPIDQQRYKGFPNFQDVDGLRTGLNFRLMDYLSTLDGNTHSNAMKDVLVLSAQPSEVEIYENSRCGKCREDWNQTGPTCRHCNLETSLRKLPPDHLIMCIIKTLWKWLKDTKFSGKMSSTIKEVRLHERAAKFFELVKANETELQKALKVWTTHFDLLSDIDELNQCKRSMRLAQEDEDLTKLTDDELNAIVAPWDIASRHMDHATKQAMALGTLRRNTQTLRYLRNQSMDRKAEEERKKSGKKDDDNENTCIVCLSTFHGERAVLACGHFFHQSPCMEKLMAQFPGHSAISCPLRCSKRTRRDEVMIATDKRKDDGSKGTRSVEGSWGTKVTRLLGDLMDVTDQGDKSIVFSQWEDMLDVVEHAMAANGVCYVRVKSMSRLGDTIKRFRSNECSVLLLNVKNGAEGLTLVEATHVFMIEPLLNCGLDSQAIARVNRIGQTNKTYVHRYLIEGTIEVKIDNIRVERQEDQLEDSINDAKKKHDISAGGIDGGFSEAELQDILK